MSEAKRYEGSCHCGKVRYQVSTALEQVISCNCSICSRAGWLLTFVPAADFELLSGESDIADYRFHTKKIAHKFCTTCGIRSFAYGKNPDGSDVRAINVRCLDGVDLDALTITKVDGRSF